VPTWAVLMASKRPQTEDDRREQKKGCEKRRRLAKKVEYEHLMANEQELEVQNYQVVHCIDYS